MKLRVRLVLLQTGILAVLRAARLSPDVKKSTAACAVACLLLHSRRSSLARPLSRVVLSLGSLPAVSEAIESGLGQADVPALLAIHLGSLLRYDAAALVILLMLTGGEILEEYALDRAGSTLHSLLERSPGVAHRKREKGRDQLSSKCEQVPTEMVQVGDTLLVKGGETVPVDGVVEALAVDGEESCIDESLLTGENMRIKKTVGDQVLGGSINKGAPLWITVEKPYAQSILFLMKAQLKSALERKGKTELRSKRFAALFTPLTMAIAAGAWQLGKLQNLDSYHRWERVLSVLMSATPCPASIGVPIAMLSGMSSANNLYGGTIKSGDALERLANISTVVLDKTGTLTCGTPSVVEFQTESTSLTPAECLRLVASVEQLSTHPLASAVCKFHQRTDDVLYKSQKVQMEQGAGVYGCINELDVYVGTLNHLETLGLDSLVKSSHAQTNDIVSYFLVISKGNRLADGRILFQDSLRTTAKPLIAKLRNLELRIVLLSGDRSQHLEAVAKELGITEYSCCWPHEKAERIEALKREGETVLMVGDGANDSAALVAADVGLSMGASNLATESADVVLMNEDLNNIANLIGVGKRVTTIATRTVKYGMSASILQMLLAASGQVSPFVCACMQEGIDLFSILYALRSLLV